jgi:hypothetical protein
MISLYQSIRATLAASVLHALGQIAGFIPNLLSALVILILGWLLAIVLCRVTRKALESVGVDALAERHGVSQTHPACGRGAATCLLHPHDRKTRRLPANGNCCCSYSAGRSFRSAVSVKFAGSHRAQGRP